MGNYPGKISESNILYITVSNHDNPIDVLLDHQIQIPVIYDYTDFTPDYTTDEWWYYDKKAKIVHIMIANVLRIRYLAVVQKRESGQLLSVAEEKELKDCEHIINVMPQLAAEKAMKEYVVNTHKVIEKSIEEENSITYSNEKEQQKKNYRTKKAADNTTDNLPTSLAIITNDQYKGGLGLSQTGGAYLYPLASTDGLSYDGKTLFFKGCPISEAKLKEINKNKDVAIDYIDLPLLRMFYSIILSDFEVNARKLGVVDETVSVYVPDLATLFGKGRNISRNDVNSIIEKTSSFQTIYGVLKDPKRPNGIGTAVPLLVWLGYEEETNTIKFASPYMTELIKRIYNVSIRKDKKGFPKLKKNGEPLLDVSHSYLIKSSIVKERNKRATEIVIVVVTTIEQAGNNIPHLKARTILDRVPQLKKAIDRTKTTADKNRLLKRAFSKAWKLLDTQTTLREKYPTIILPNPENPKNIPTMATLDMLFEFPHPEHSENK